MKVSPGTIHSFPFIVRGCEEFGRVDLGMLTTGGMRRSCSFMIAPRRPEKRRGRSVS